MGEGSVISTAVDGGRTELCASALVIMLKNASIVAIAKATVIEIALERFRECIIAFPTLAAILIILSLIVPVEDE